MPVKPSESEAEYFARLEVERRTHAWQPRRVGPPRRNANAYSPWRGTTVRSVAPRW